MRHLHVVLVLVLVRAVQELLLVVQIVLVRLEDGGHLGRRAGSLLREQLAPLLLVGVGGVLERQRRAEAEPFRRRESLGRLLECERNLENKG